MFQQQQQQLTGLTGSIRKTEPLGKSMIVYLCAVRRRPFLRHSIDGFGVPIAEQIKLATFPDITYWSLGGVMIRGGWPADDD